ncbi:hypothetical protein [Actinomadura harenae]|uniref:Hemophore-related protein n=1 Tax=Actinomadura harenae TaxID=2483351 RepID=A0A3M2M470_9ACTN|nr:hypothetical protein [Actinomadura harenae]RMI44477.1 hypothetical protein EBO15_12580 [Actinomadura harenae]
MNVRAVVFASSCAFALGVAVVPAHAAPVRAEPARAAATCDYNAIKELTVEQVTEMMPPGLRDETRHDIMYQLLRVEQVQDLPLYYRDKVLEACRQ